jgi:hemolysin activation/secretion protein
MHPLIRATAGNLYVQLQFDHKQLHDDIDVASIRTDRHTNGWTAVVAGDRRDDHGVTNFNVSATVGRVTFDNDASLIADRFGANTQGADSHYLGGPGNARRPLVAAAARGLRRARLAAGAKGILEARSRRHKRFDG